jgi:hypothetical protein
MSHTATCGLSFAFCFCNLLAREYKVRPLCSGGSAFGHESLGLCQHNKPCFLLICLRVLSAHNFLQQFSSAIFSQWQKANTIHYWRHFTIIYGLTCRPRRKKMVFSGSTSEQKTDSQYSHRYCTAVDVIIFFVKTQGRDKLEYTFWKHTCILFHRKQ